VLSVGDEGALTRRRRRRLEEIGLEDNRVGNEGAEALSVLLRTPQTIKVCVRARVGTCRRD
jgi:hypothetical protein